MKSLRAILPILLLLATLPGLAQRVVYSYHCDTDTTRAGELLGELAQLQLSPGDAVLHAAQSLIGADTGTLQADSTETLRIDLHTFTPVSFVENVLALAKTSDMPSPSWRKLADNLLSLRYRHGELTDFTSRLLYNSEWVTENIYRGNIKEITPSLPGAMQTTRSLDFVTRNVDLYPPLRDSLLYDKQKMLEWGLRSYRIPYMRKEAAWNKKVVRELRDGDIMVLLSPDKHTDADDMGIIRLDEGKIYLIHPSKSEGKVIEEPIPVADWFKHQGRTVPGFRILRIE